MGRTSVRDRLETLRGLLHNAPSPAIWGGIIDVFHNWRDDSAQVGVAYTCAHLERWPDTLRVSPPWLSWRRPSLLWPLIRQLRLSGPRIRDKTLASVARSPHLTGLTGLELEATAISRKGIHALATSDTLPALAHLTLRDLPLPAPTLEPLLHAPCFAHLDTLTFDRCDLSPSELRALTCAPWTPRLGALTLIEDPHSAAATANADMLVALVQHTPWPRLRALTLSNLSLSPLDLVALGCAPSLASLRALTIALPSHGQLTGVSAASLLEAAWADQLETLHLSNFSISPDEAAAITGPWTQTPPSHLSDLALTHANLKNVCVAMLAMVPWNGRLRRLDLSYNALSDSAVAYLCDCAHLNTLEHLDLSNNMLSNPGILKLTQAPFAPQLAHLNLAYNRTSRAVLARVRDHPNLANCALATALPNWNPNSALNART